MTIRYCDFCGEAIEEGTGDPVTLADVQSMPEAALDACDPCTRILWRFVRDKSLRKSSGSALHKDGDAQRMDRVELDAGIVHLPAQVRSVAEKANRAGLEGYKVVDVEYGIDVEAARQIISEAPGVPDFSVIGSRIKIMYERITVSPASDSAAPGRDGLAGDVPPRTSAVDPNLDVSSFPEEKHEN